MADKYYNGEVCHMFYVNIQFKNRIVVVSSLSTATNDDYNQLRWYRGKKGDDWRLVRLPPFHCMSGVMIGLIRVLLALLRTLNEN